MSPSDAAEQVRPSQARETDADAAIQNPTAAIAEEKTLEPEVSPISTDSIAEPENVSSAPSSDHPGDEQQVSTEAYEGVPLSAPKEWMSYWLKRWLLLVLGGITIGMIGTIIGLLIASQRYNGFAFASSSEQNEKTYYGFKLGPSLAYSFLVVLLFQLYGMAFSSVVDACAKRQPYVELMASSGGPSAKDSFLLDYSGNAFKSIWRAIKGRHAVLLAGFILSLLLKIGLIPLAAHLFDVSAVVTSIGSSFTLNSEFNEEGFGSVSDLLPALDLAEAVQVYDALPPPWVSTQYAFQNFSAPLGSGPLVPYANVSVNLDAYSAKLDCVHLPFPSNLTIAKDPSSIPINLSDRGCNYSTVLSNIAASGAYYSTFLETFADVTCDLDAGFSRLGVVTGLKAIPGEMASSLTLTNISIVSCISSYHRDHGALSAIYNGAVGPSSIPSIQNFSVDSSMTLSNPRPVFWKSFETQLHQAGIYDNSATISASQFGYLIYTRAQKINAEGYFDPGVVAQATSDMFQTVYALMANQLLFRAAPNTTSGKLIVQAERIFIQPPIAYVTIAILALAVLELLCILFYVQRHRSILYEEPRGILGAASLLWNNEFRDELDKRFAGKVDDGKVWERVEKDAQLGDIGWTYADWNNPRVSGIVAAAKRRSPAWDDAVRRNG